MLAVNWGRGGARDNSKSICRLLGCLGGLQVLINVIHYSLPHAHSTLKDYLLSSYLSLRAWSLLELIFFPG